MNSSADEMDSRRSVADKGRVKTKRSTVELADINRSLANLLGGSQNEEEERAKTFLQSLYKAIRSNEEASRLLDKQQTNELTELLKNSLSEPDRSSVIMERRMSKVVHENIYKKFLEESVKEGFSRSLVLPRKRVWQIMKNETNCGIQSSVVLLMTKTVENFIQYVTRGSAEIMREKGKVLLNSDDIVSFLAASGKFDLIQESLNFGELQQFASERSDSINGIKAKKTGTRSIDFKVPTYESPSSPSKEVSLSFQAKKEIQQTLQTERLQLDNEWDYFEISDINRKMVKQKL